MSFGKIMGPRRGEVKDIDDPKKMFRVKVCVFDLFEGITVESLPWAEIVFPIGARANEGAFTPLKVGDIVWVEFMGGDTRRPVVTGSVHYAPDNKPNLPHEAWQGPDAIAHKRAVGEPVVTSTVYGRDVVFTRNGVTVIINSDSSFSAIQRGTKTEIHVSPQGDITLHGEKGVFISSVEGVKVQAGGEIDMESAAKVKITAPAVDVIGDVAITGDVHISGATHSAGNITSDGSIIDSGGNTPHHAH